MNFMLLTLVCIIEFVLIVNAAPVKPLIQGKFFDNVLIVFFENADYDDAVRYFNFVTKAPFKGHLLTNYKALFHPSQPNYLAVLTGDREAWFDNDVDVDKYNLVDLLEQKGISWRSYQELYPGDCFTGSKGKYARKHNPFISMNDIRNDKARCANIVNARELVYDFHNGTLPRFMFYTPDLDNDGHDTSVSYAARWARTFLTPFVENLEFMKTTLVILTWDESEDYFNDNQVATYLIGAGLSKDKTDNTAYNHYSLLKTIEENWDLGTLGSNDDPATRFRNLVSRNS